MSQKNWLKGGRISFFFLLKGLRVPDPRDTRGRDVKLKTGNLSIGDPNVAVITVARPTAHDPNESVGSTRSKSRRCAANTEAVSANVRNSGKRKVKKILD